MIKQIKITDNFSADNLFLIKIKANALCYGKFDFCRTFSQETNGCTAAYINIVNNSAVVFMLKNADNEEIRSFLKFYGVKTVFCNQNFSIATKGIILNYAQKSDFEQGIYTATVPNYKSAYSLLNQEFLLPDYNEFVSDLSFRKAHGFARIMQTEKGIVFTLWETTDKAVISALAIERSSRSEDHGTCLLQNIVADLQKDNKEILVYCEEKTKNFYIKNGFSPIGYYFTGELN